MIDEIVGMLCAELQEYGDDTLDSSSRYVDGYAAGLNRAIKIVKEWQKLQAILANIALKIE